MDPHGIGLGVSVDRLHIPDTFLKKYKKFFFHYKNFPRISKNW